MLKKFDALQLGDSALEFNYARHSHGIIIEKYPESYKSVFSCWPAAPDNLLSAVLDYYNQSLEWRYDGKEDEGLKAVFRTMRGYNQTMLENYSSNSPAEVLNQINKIFTMIDFNYRENNREEKIAYLRAHISPSHKDAQGVIDKFLIKFKYHEIFLNRHPFMRMIKASAATRQNRFSGMVFYNTRYEPKITETFEKSKIIVPQLGKTLLVNESLPGQELIEADFF